MAKKSSKTRTVRSVRSPRSNRAKARRAVSRSKSFLGGHKIKVGEAILSALVGYEGGNILDGTGVPNMLASNSKIGPYLYDQSVAVKAAGYSDVTYGKVINKDIGLVAIAKVVYDLIEKKRMDENDKNILIPYALGTVFDKEPKSGSSQGAW